MDSLEKIINLLKKSSIDGSKQCLNDLYLTLQDDAQIKEAISCPKAKEIKSTFGLRLKFALEQGRQVSGLEEALENMAELADDFRVGGIGVYSSKKVFRFFTDSNLEKLFGWCINEIES